MIRKHENSDSWRAAILAIAVHAALLIGMLVSINWKAAHPVLNVTEVELWDKLPAPAVVDEPKPEPKPVIEEKPEPPPVIKEEPKPEPKPEPKVEDPKVDIELEQKKKELEQKLADEKLKKEKELEEKLKNDQAKKKLAQQIRDEDLGDKKAAEKQEKLERDKALRKLQEEMSNENGADDAKASSAANAGIINEYKAKIQAKIKANVNKNLCGDGSPEIRVEISVLPTGQISGNPKITKSSENSACDEAVERAIIASEPLPLPDDPDLKSQFRNLNLRFTPND